MFLRVICALFVARRERGVKQQQQQQQQQQHIETVLSPQKRKLKGGVLANTRTIASCNLEYLQPEITVLTSRSIELPFGHVTELKRMRSAKNKFRRVAEIVGCHNLHIRDETFSLPFLRFEAIELVKRLDESK